jgi:hypothetical protein
MQGRYLLTDDWILRSFVDINLCPMSVVLRYVGIGKNRLNRTLRNTRVTIDASICVYVEPIWKFVKSFDGAYGCAVRVFAVNTKLDYYIGHWGSKLLSRMNNK